MRVWQTARGWDLVKLWALWWRLLGCTDTEMADIPNKTENREWSGITNWAFELFATCQKSKQKSLEQQGKCHCRFCWLCVVIFLFNPASVKVLSEKWPPWRMNYSWLIIVKQHFTVQGGASLLYSLVWWFPTWGSRSSKGSKDKYEGSRYYFTLKKWKIIWPL